MYGVKVGDTVLLTDAGIGKRIVETEPPSSVPTGYESRGVWVETADQLMWESTSDGNVREPGAVGEPWEDKGPWPSEEAA